MKNAITLQADLEHLRTSLGEKDALLARKDKRIHQLEALLKEAMHQRFGASSEKLITQEQAQLFDEAEAYADDVQAAY